MSNFNKNYENFNFRKVSTKFDRKDRTGIRFIDTASKEAILSEYNLIKEKTSKLPSNERGLITKMVEG